MSISMDRRWRDPALPAAEGGELLLWAKTLEEKVAHLGSRSAGSQSLEDASRDGPGRRAMMRITGDVRVVGHDRVPTQLTIQDPGGG